VIARDAGVVDEVIDTPVLRYDPLDRLAARRWDADVALVKMNPRSASIEMAAQGVGAFAIYRQTENRDGRAVGR
jgi:hypothetical protein